MDPLDPIPSDPNPPPALPLSTKGADRRPPRPLAHQSRPPNQQRHAHPDPHLDTTAPSARSRPPGSARRPPATPDPQTPRASPTLPHRAASAGYGKTLPASKAPTANRPATHTPSAPEAAAGRRPSRPTIRSTTPATHTHIRPPTQRAQPDPTTARASPTLPHRAASTVLRKSPTSWQSTDREQPSHSHLVGTRSRAPSQYAFYGNILASTAVRPAGSATGPTAD